MGLVYPAGLLNNADQMGGAEGEFFYCPTMSPEYGFHTYRSFNNPWISDLLQPGAPSSLCRAGYSARCNNPKSLSNTVDGRAIGFAQALASGPNNTGWEPVDASSSDNRVPLMKTTQMGVRGIVGDILVNPDRVKFYGHKNGFNVLCADGSAKWINAADVQTEFENLGKDRVQSFEDLWNKVDKLVS
jgi:hypothetical protein